MSSGEPESSGGHSADSERLVFVKLVRAGERRPFSGAQENTGNDDTKVGVVVTPLSVKLDKLRAVMVTQIPAQLPQQFGFLSANRYPVADNQESLVELRSIVDSEPAVTIRNMFDEEPFGIRTTNGIAIGFIFADPNSTAEQLRALIDATSIFPGPPSEALITGHNSRPDYQFVFRDEYPVTTGQESILTARDLSRSGTIRIIPIHERHRHHNERQSTDERPADEFSIAGLPQSRPTAAGDTTDATPARINSTHSSRPISHAPANPANKTVMISYVTSEARPQAVHIQRALESMNVPVFLDVNDIPTAANWDDILNQAVLGCRLFVALVTRSYGATEWTSRELRLAFQKHIPVVPINFLDNYPPDSVAIYFSTQQHFTPAFKLPAGRGKSADYWEESFAEPTAKEIVECVNREVFNWRPSSTIANNSGVSNRNDQLREDGTWYGFRDQISIDSGIQTLGPTVERSKALPLVVISAHPVLKSLVDLIKGAFRRLAIDTWSSTDISINERNLKRSRALPIEFESPVVGDGNRDVRFLQSNTTDGQVRQPVGSPYVTSSRLMVEKGKAFLENAKKADVLLVLGSKEYFRSKTSIQQAFHCVLYDRVLAISNDTSESPPHWLSMFKQSMARGMQDTDEEVVHKITETVRAMLSVSSGETSAEIASDGSVGVDSVVSVIRRNIVDVSDENAILVYLRGSDRDSTPISEQLSHAIGQKLAYESSVILITDGFSVESQIVSQSFVESRYSNSDVYHVMLDEDISANPAMGTVVGVNGSAHELDSAVASLFDACFLVENSQRRDRIAQLFSWKEKIVALIVDNSDVDREVSAVVESIRHRSRPKNTTS